MITEKQKVLQEWIKCEDSPVYFINKYCNIYDATSGDWVPFILWPKQIEALNAIHNNQLIIILKARQLGLTWLALCYALWLMVFNPICTALIFSRRDDDAAYLISDERLRGIYSRLPQWMQAKNVVKESAHHWSISNGSNIRSFPTTGGDSYTASYVMVDEADLIPDLNKLMRSVKPTIDAGGKLVLISRSDKSKPNSEFKNIFKAAIKGENGWAQVFLSWRTRLSRNEEWYERQRRDIISRTGSLDDLWEQYPSTYEEALAPKTFDKRIMPTWLLQCYHEEPPLEFDKSPAISGLVQWFKPRDDRTYVIGIDPAEGNPNSDDSALCVLCYETRQMVAKLAGKYEPFLMAYYANKIAEYYNGASIMVERNNHGGTVISWLQESSSAALLSGHDGRIGWMSSRKGKTILYDNCAEALKENEIEFFDFETYAQLSSIEGNTLRAPEGDHDDHADAFALAVSGLNEMAGDFTVLDW